MNTEKNKEKWIEMIKENLQLGRRSKTTIRNYVYAITHFLNYYNEKEKISSFKEKEIIEYLKKNYLDNNAKETTYNFNLSAIKFFYSICFNVALNNRLLPRAKTKRKLPIIMSKKDFINMVNQENNLEHKCFLVLGFCCGLRACETVTVRIENIDSKNHKLKVLGKGNKERFTILPDIVIKFLRLYYKSKNMKETEGYLFKGIKDNEHIIPRTLENYFTNYANELKLDTQISYHTLRHSFSTYFLMNGGDIFTLKDLLGHNCLSTTAIYVHLAHDFNSLKGVRYEK